MDTKKHREGGAGGDFSPNDLEVFFHGEFVLADEELLKGVETVLFVEDKHGLAV